VVLVRSSGGYELCLMVNGINEFIFCEYFYLSRRHRRMYGMNKSIIYFFRDLSLMCDRSMP